METHTLDLSEEEQLQIALALSADEQQLSASAAEDERLARQLQEEEYAAAAEAAGGAGAGAAGAATVPPPPSAAQPAASPTTMPPATGGPPAAAPTAAGLARPPSSPGRLVDNLKVASADAMQRIGSGSQQLWGRLKRHLGEPSPAPPAPYYAPAPVHPALHPYGTPPHQQQAYGGPAHVPPGGGQWQGQQAPPPQQPQHAQRPQQPGRSQLSEDEALALALQQQLDMEERYQQQQHWQQQQQQPTATGPLGAGAAAATAAAAGVPGAPPRPGALPPPAPAAAAAPRPRPSHSSRSCAGCGGGISTLLGSRGAFVSALGRNWHPGCFVCGGCRRPIGTTSGVPFVERDGLPWHLECFRERYIPRCAVCHQFIPEQGNRRIVWNEVPFWKQRYCPEHEGVAPRCAGCDRLRPAGEDWAELEDGRQLCLQCLDTITTDTRDAQPLWQSVLAFYASLGLSLPTVPPMMLVDSGALNEAEGQETHGRGRGGGPVFHVRGLTLTEEYASIRTILRIPGGNPFAIQRQPVAVGPTRCEVTGILVVYGLPRLLTGSILAHEVMHAWLRLSGCTRLPEQVEEGLCQLMALLWLEAQADKGFKDDYEERLAAYLGHQIRSDTSAIYGDGFRLAHEAFQVHGLAPLVQHVRQMGTFPAS
ncbi:hypothetical protein ABPG75_007972 [Micractinium tetrahymenae]